jgi:MinD superfamily P-loop ATPase
MIITIASGKGGTGKTTIATNVARAAQQPVLLLDCDVEEPNAHLFLRPTMMVTTPVNTLIPQIDVEKCTSCGTCAAICEFNAMAVIKKNVLVFPELCHGCGGCTLICPEGAITEVAQEIGSVAHGHAGHIQFVHGTLKVGKAMAGPVIKAVKNHIDGQPLVIIDAPPGTSCPVVTTLLGSDFCMLVTEPTPFGLHDLKLAVEVVRQLQIPHGVVMNQADIGDTSVEAYCHDQQIPVLMRIPTDMKIAEAYSRGEMIVDVFPEYREKFRRLLTIVAREQGSKGAREQRSRGAGEQGSRGGDTHNSQLATRNSQLATRNL